jgi:hypothetical protein
MITPPVTRLVNNGIQRAVYVPLRRIVTNVTNAIEPTVTTSENHGFATGQSLRLIVPDSYGMDVNERGIATVINDTQFTITVNTLDLDVFATPVITNFTDAQVIADSGTWNNIGEP